MPLDHVTGDITSLQRAAELGLPAEICFLYTQHTEVLYYISSFLGACTKGAHIKFVRLLLLCICEQFFVEIVAQSVYFPYI